MIKKHIKFHFMKDSNVKLSLWGLIKEIKKIKINKFKSSSFPVGSWQETKSVHA